MLTQFAAAYPATPTNAIPRMMSPVRAADDKPESGCAITLRLLSLPRSD